MLKKYTNGHGENSPTKSCSFGHVCGPNDVWCVHEGMSLAGKSHLSWELRSLDDTGGVQMMLFACELVIDSGGSFF